MPHEPGSRAGISVDLAAARHSPKRRLHGVNNGPVGYGSLVDVSHHYEALDIPTVRLHDPDWPHPRSVDIPQVFPDPDADPDDPGSYDFLRTDEYVRSVLDTGARIVYRLGTSIEHTTVKTFTHPPTDYERWARICTRIIDHYNDGWAEGFHYGLDYWEIWNEPDVPSELMWSGTAEQYFELYRVAATAIKAAHPEIKVGGPAAARGGGADELADRFVAFCSDQELPLDFFSWHIYTDSVDAIAARAEWARRLLDRHGFTATESHLNEWNYLTGDFWTFWQRGQERERRRVFTSQKDREGAAFAVAVLLSLQDLPVDVANYYDGQPSALFCGLFDPYGVPQKAYYGFQAFRELCAADHLVSTTVAPEGAGIRARAGAREDGDALILVSAVDTAARELGVDVRGLEPGCSYACEVRTVDEEYDLDVVATSAVDAGSSTLTVAVQPHTVLLLTLRRT